MLKLRRSGARSEEAACRNGFFGCIYGGLLCAAYLILFGVSSLMFNHPGMWPAGKGKVNSERAVEVSGSVGDDEKVSEAIRDELGLIGWTIPWETRRLAGNELTFGVSRPGKHYKIHYDPAATSVKVVETRMGYGESFDRCTAS
jgi:hypothetical protein